MVVRNVVGNAVITLSPSGKLVIEKNKFELIGIHVTEKNMELVK